MVKKKKNTFELFARPKMLNNYVKKELISIL